MHLLSRVSNHIHILHVFRACEQYLSFLPIKLFMVSQLMLLSYTVANLWGGGGGGGTQCTFSPIRHTGTVNWKIFELKIFHKKTFRVKKFRSYGWAKFLTRLKDDVI